MKTAMLALLLVLIVFSGCSGPIPGTSDVNQTAPVGGLGRSFIYEPPRAGSAAVSSTVAESMNGDASLIYGTTNLTVKDCILMDEGLSKFRCISQAAVYLNDSSICGNLMEEPAEAACYDDYALKKADLAACLLIDELNNSNSAYGSMSQSCKRAVAMFTGNSSLCVYAPADPEGPKKAELCSYFADSRILVGKDNCHEDLPAYLLSESVYFGETYRWLMQTHPGEKVLSWWDYGTAMDCVGLQSVISHQDLQDSNILEVAYLFVEGNESELVDFMKRENATYVLLDSELFLGPSGYFGMKYGALNYLSCARNGQIDYSENVGDSACERDNLWETIYFRKDSSNSACVLSQSDGQLGALAYHLYETKEGEKVNAGFYPSLCQNATESLADYCGRYSFEPAYCIGNMTLADGKNVSGFYKLNERDENGRLRPHKALPGAVANLPGAYQLGDASMVTLVYTNNKLWIEDGNLTGGYGDRNREFGFYDSMIYKAFFATDELEQLELVYSDPSGNVRVFGLKQ